MALALPDENSGMECIIEGKEQEMPYKVGNIYLHSGLFQHRIKDTKTISKDKPRITLQGHGGTLQFSRHVGFYLKTPYKPTQSFSKNIYRRGVGDP